MTVSWGTETDWNNATKNDIDVNGSQFQLKEVPLPNSAIHRWSFDEGSGSVAADSIGSYDADLTGLSWTSGNWYGDYAIDNDGSGYGNAGDLGDFGSNIGGEYAVAFTINVDQWGDYRFLGLDNEFDSTRFWFVLEENTFGFMTRNNSGEKMRVQADGSYSTGTTYRVFLNSTGNNDTDHSWWVNGSNVGRTTIEDDTPGYDYSNFDQGFGLGAYHNGGDGTFSEFLDGRLDEVVIYDSALTESEIHDDYIRQPWS